MKLDFSSLQKALESLNVAVERSQGAPQDNELRDAVIQRFEYSYELCGKMLKRRLELDHPQPAQVDQFSFRELIREGAERGYVENVEAWIEYRRQRNLTSHVYDEDVAKSVYETALTFLGDAEKLLGHLTR